MNKKRKYLGELIGGNEGETVDTDLMDTVDGLEDTTHPLERVLLGHSRLLLRHDADPLVPQHSGGEDGDSPAVDELHGFDGQHRRDQVVRAVLPTRHRHQSRPRTDYEHHPTLQTIFIPYISHYFIIFQQY